MDKSYRIFISHSWQYNSNYDRLLEFFQEWELDYYNHSIPSDDPIHTNGTDRQLIDAIESKLLGVSCVIVLAGVYASYSKWMIKEIEAARSMGKYIIAIEPWASERTSKFVKDNADVIVKWQGKSIIEAIENCN